jgi:hypothetical protein
MDVILKKISTVGHVVSSSTLPVKAQNAGVAIVAEGFEAAVITVGRKQQLSRSHGA